MNTEFKEFKDEILKRAKAANACADEYRRAYKSEGFSELMQVIKDNFNFTVTHKIIEPVIIEAYKEQFNADKIFCNVNATDGYLLVDNATVRAGGNATVEASGNATVEVWGNATVRAGGNATVRAWDNATVRASGNAYITSYYTIECQLSDNAIHRIRESNTIRYVSDNIKFEKVDFKGE